MAFKMKGFSAFTQIDDKKVEVVLVDQENIKSIDKNKDDKKCIGPKCIDPKEDAKIQARHYYKNVKSIAPKGIINKIEKDKNK